MATSSSPAGGVLIAIGAVLGAFIGLAYDQPTVGTLAGIAIGVVLALAIWWRTRERR